MKLYTVKEAAKVVGVSTNTLYKYLDEDRIHAARGTALQGRFRIPESALEEFLGVKLTQPEPESPVPQGFDLEGSAQPRDMQSAEGQTLQDHKSHLPLKLARFFLVLALVAMLLDLFISHAVSLPGQISRLFFLLVMLLLAYSEGGFRRQPKSL